MKQDIISLANKKVGDIDLDDAIFGIDVRGDLHGHRVHREPGPGRDDALGGCLRERVVPRHALVSERRAVVRGEDGIELDARLAASAHDVHSRLTRPVVHRRVPCAPIA